MLFGTEVFEIQILKSVHSALECGFMDFIMPFFSALGNGGMLWIAIAVILIFTKKRKISSPHHRLTAEPLLKEKPFKSAVSGLPLEGKLSSRARLMRWKNFINASKYRRCGITILVCMLIGLLIGNLTLKPLVARPRPCWIDTEFPLLISNPTDFSHPSGHTLSSFIAAFVMLKTDKRLGIPGIIAAGIIAFSRLYLFVHFPTDILAGILLAWLITLPLKKLH